MMADIVPPPPKRQQRPRRRIYVNIPCPVGHDTWARRRGRLRYCPTCKHTYTSDGLVYDGLYKYDPYIWTHETDNGDDWTLTREARRALLAEIDALNEAEHAERLKEWNARKV